MTKPPVRRGAVERALPAGTVVILSGTFGEEFIVVSHRYSAHGLWYKFRSQFGYSTEAYAEGISSVVMEP